MKNIVKLDAINSTNQYIKDQLKKESLKSGMVFTAEYQTEGRGQIYTSWVSERSKNLLFSIYLEYDNYEIEYQYYLICAVSLGILHTLKMYHIDELSIKWPNDIMAGEKKVAGILIENTFVHDKIKNTIVGIGLNVNQGVFPEYIPEATSLKNLLGKEMDRESVLKGLLINIEHYLELLKHRDLSVLKRHYDRHLYRKGIFSDYENKKGEVFKARILGVNKQGKLLVEQEGNELKTYDFKEIKFI